MPPLSMAKSFMLSRLRGETPLRTVFWRDMLLAGTALNILAGIAGIILLTSGFSTSTALTVYFSPLPWNLFLFFAVWRSSERIPISEAAVVRAVSTLWLVLVILI